MNFAVFARAGVLALAALFAIGAGGNWNTTVKEAGGAHWIGNPDAKVKMIEFISYTCPHCAHFAVEGEAPLQLAYIGPGRLQVEVRPVMRNAPDLVASLLVRCGPPSKFLRNHTMFLLEQDKWLQRYKDTTKSQRDRWASGPQSARRRAIASDLGFYPMMQTRGYSRIDVDKCLADDDAARTLAEQSQAAEQKYGVVGTPTFVVDGIKLAGTADWSMLSPQLAARF